MGDFWEMRKAPGASPFCAKSLWAFRHFRKANFPAPRHHHLFPLSRRERAPSVFLFLFRLVAVLMETLGGRASIYAHVADDSRVGFWEMRKLPKLPEFSPFRGIPEGFLHFHNANLILPAPHPPCFRLVEGGGRPRVISLRLRLARVLTTNLTGRASIYAHVAEGAMVDFWEMRKVSKVPEFSPFWAELLGAFQRFPNANFTGISPCCRLVEGGGPMAILFIPRLETVNTTTLGGIAIIYAHVAEGGRRGFWKCGKRRKRRNFRYFRENH